MPRVPSRPLPPAPGQSTTRVLVGRDAELQSLWQHASRARREGPGIAVVHGASGTGKTALLEQFAAGLTDQLVLSVAATGPEPLALCRRLVDTLKERGMAGAAVLGGTGVRPHEVGQRLLTALTAAAAGRPVTVVIDDVDLADVESSLALGFVSRRLFGQQFLFVLGVRSADDGDVEPNVRRIMPARGDLLRIRLAGLATEDIQSLAHAFGVIPFGQRDAEAVRRQSGGNPRHVARLLDQIRRDPHARPTRTVVLRSVTAAVTARIAELPEPSRLLLSALSVLDDRCPLATAAQVAGIAEPLRALEPLLVGGLADWWPAEPTTPVRIRSGVQQATYQAIPPGTRLSLHGRAAAVVPAGRALAHRMRAVPGGCDPGLADELAAAAWRWIAEGRLEQAAQYLLWAAEITEPGQSREHRLLLGVSLLQRASRNEAAGALRERARGCRPSPLRSFVMGRFAMIDGEVALARDLLESAVAELERDPGAPDYATVAAIGTMWLAVFYAWQRESELSRHAAGRCLAVSPFGRRIDRGAELLYLSACSELEGPVVANARLREMAGLAASPGEVAPADAPLLIKRGHLRLLAGEPADAVADIEAGLQTGHGDGIADVDEWGHFWACAAHVVLDSWDRAADHARAALDLALGDDARPYLASMLAINAFVEANTGELAAAAEHAVAAAELAENFYPPADRVFPALAAAAIAVAKSDPAAVAEALDPFAGQASGWMRVYRWLWWPIHVEALLDLGRTERAGAELAAMAEEIACGFRVLTVPHLYLAGRAAQATGDHATARTHYQQAINAAAALASPAWRAKAVEAYQRIATDIRAPASSLAELLTTRERAIAALIADGHSNRAVSRCLGITEKTIEAHLTRVYRKLAVKSRHELRAALGHAGRKATPPGVLTAWCARSGNQSHASECAATASLGIARNRH